MSPNNGLNPCLRRAHWWRRQTWLIRSGSDCHAPMCRCACKLHNVGGVERLPLGTVNLHGILRHLFFGVRHHRQPTPDFCSQRPSQGREGSRGGNAREMKSGERTFCQVGIGRSSQRGGRVRAYACMHACVHRHRTCSGMLPTQGAKLRESGSSGGQGGACARKCACAKSVGCCGRVGLGERWRECKLHACGCGGGQPLAPSIIAKPTHCKCNGAIMTHRLDGCDNSYTCSTTTVAQGNGGSANGRTWRRLLQSVE